MLTLGWVVGITARLTLAEFGLAMWEARLPAELLPRPGIISLRPQDFSRVCSSLASGLRDRARAHARARELTAVCRVAGRKTGCVVWLKPRWPKTTR